MDDVAGILDTFELLGDWEQRYQYLVELGDALPAMAEHDRVEGNRVKPCMSQVWVHLARDPARPGCVAASGDCDTAIIKGVVALLVSLCDGKTPKEVLDTDFDGLFEGLRLAEHLSPSRHVGTYAIVEKLREQAASLVAGGERGGDR
jgi:cysteine desulfuration protein SufE